MQQAGTANVTRSVRIIITAEKPPMQPYRRTLTFAVALAFLSAPALAQQSGASSPAMPAVTGGPTSAQSPADQAMMAGMTKMNKAMSGAEMTGDADRDFVAMMMPHHQGAIDMARVELHYGKDATLRKLAQDIVTAQKREIAEMQRWQAKHPAP